MCKEICLKLFFYIFHIIYSYYNKLLVNNNNKKIYYTWKKNVCIIICTFYANESGNLLCVFILFVLLLWKSRTWQILRLLEWVAFDDVAVDLLFWLVGPHVLINFSVFQLYIRWKAVLLIETRTIFVVFVFLSFLYRGSKHL